jgi:hypothetical protein
VINKNEVFTFTLLYRDEDDKVILIKSGEVPAKSEDEADSVLSLKNEDEKEAVEKIIDKMFPSAESGSEDSITNSLEDFENKYDISLEDLEEEVGQDLDNDSEKDENSEHAEKVLDGEEEKEEGSEEGEYPVFAILSIDAMTDPTASIIPRHKSHFTHPDAFSTEELVEDEDEAYNPILSVSETVSEDEEDVLEEAASPMELVKRFIQTAASTRKGVFNVAAVTDIFNQLHVVDADAKLEALQLSLKTGNVKLFQGPGQNAIQGRMAIAGEPLLVIGNPTGLPEGATEISLSDGPAVNQALSKFVGRF